MNPGELTASFINQEQERPYRYDANPHAVWGRILPAIYSFSSSTAPSHVAGGAAMRKAAMRSR